MKRLLCLSLMLFATLCAQAQTKLRHALVIGVSTYADPRVPVLLGVPADMQSARQIAQAMGIPADQITVLRDAEATKQNIVDHMERIGRRAGEGSRVLVYFSGHGTRWQDPEAGGCVEGLFTYDSQAIVNREFAALAQPLGAKADKVIFMFDACHSGGVGTMRAMPGAGDDRPRPKFFLKSDDVSANACSRPVNIRTRSLLGAGARGIDQLPENVVLITSSHPDEVSFDEAGKGGLATQGMRNCLLGQAKDLDGSGAITLAEIETCAQDFVRERIKQWPELLPQHVTVSGLRNLIPVPVVANAAPAPGLQASAGMPGPAGAVPTAAANAAAGEPAALPVTAQSARAERQRLENERAQRAERDRVEALAQARQREDQLRQEQQRLAREQSALAAERLAEQMRAERAAADQAAREQQQREAAARVREERERQQLVAAAQERDRQLAQAQAQAARDRQRDEPARRPEPPPSALPAGPAADLPQPVGAVAALRDLYDQRDRRHVVDARASSGRLKIGRDPLELTVTSSVGGYLYVVLLGSDETSFYMLFPNGLDRDNRIAAGVPTRLPRPNWQVQASGPAGTDNLLVIVADAPRDLSRLSLAPTGASAPFTYTAADVVGRSKLIAFMLGESPRNDGVPRFGARWLTIEETP